MSLRNLFLKAATGTLLAMAAQAATADSVLPTPITTKEVGKVNTCVLYRMQENGKWTDKLLVICNGGVSVTIGSYKDD